MVVCLLYFADPHDTVTVRWQSRSDPQTAEATAPFEVRPTGLQMARSCGGILGILCLLIWLLLGLLNYLRARRFPRGSISEVTEGRQLPRHLDLRHWNLL